MKEKKKVEKRDGIFWSGQMFGPKKAKRGKEKEAEKKIGLKYEKEEKGKF